MQNSAATNNDIDKNVVVFKRPLEYPVELELFSSCLGSDVRIFKLHFLQVPVVL